MENKKPVRQDNWMSTALKWGLGGMIAWNLLSPEAKNDIKSWLNQLAQGLAAYQRRQAETVRQQRINQIVSALATPNLSIVSALGLQRTTSMLPAPSGTVTNAILDPDATWREKIIHPSIVLILGKRGSGKSALGYRLLELFRYGPRPYVVGLPAAARSILSDWISIVPSLEEVPPKAIALIDETYLHYHARGSMLQESMAMSQLVNLSRQNDQTILFVSQEAR
jgi:hypothetical protein